MASEIRVNSLTNRSGLSTVSITDAGLNAVGIITAHNFQTGTTNVHSTGVTAGDGVFTGNVSVTGNLNVSGALTYEDVTNVDAVGLSTFRNGIHVTGGSVGIGTDNPTETLTLNHANGASIGLEYAGSEHGTLNVNSAAMYVRAGSGKHLILGSNGTEKLRIDSDGRLIGGSVTASNAWTGGDDLVIGNTTSGTRTGITLVSGNDADGGIYWSDGTGANVYRGQIVYNHTSDRFSFYTAAAERIRITNTGRMGVGTNDPAALLEVRDSENTTKGVAQIRISKGVGNGAAPTSVSRADSYLHIGGSEYHTSFGRYNIAFGYTNDEVGSGIPAYIGFVETSLSGYTLGDLVFGTRVNTSGSNNPTERFRITSTGVINCGHGDAINLHSSTTTGINLNGNGNSGQIVANASGNRALIIGRQANYGQVIEFFQGTNANDAAITIPAADSFGIETAGTERLRITSTGTVKIGSNTLITPSTDADNFVIDTGDVDSGLSILSATTGRIYFGDAASTDQGSIRYVHTDDSMRFETNSSERLRITSAGHKWTNNGSIFHGSNDITDFTQSSRDTYNNVSLRSGRQNAGTSPTNDNSAIKIYPAGVRSMTTGNLTGGIAWQHLDPNNSTWGSSFGSGSQIWMGAALHDTPGQERDRFNLWMNDQTSAGSNPNNLAIEAYPNGIVRHPKVPSFLAKGGTALSNSSNIVIVGSGTEFNNGGHYSTSNGRFTAPIDGIYHFSFWGLLYPHSSGVMNIYYSRNGSQYGHLVQGGADSNNHTSRAGSIMMSMSAGDYAELRINRGGNTGVNAYGSQWNMCGFLVG